ncbi:MAG: hypothetical protein R2834_10625 [Rhodothermales bacterium]
MRHAPSTTPHPPERSRNRSFIFRLLLVASIAAGLPLLVGGFGGGRHAPAPPPARECVARPGDASDIALDSLAAANGWPADLNVTLFAGPGVTPSPAVVAVAPAGEVYVGIDMIGSLGKTPGKGWVAKLVDCNNDGIVDTETIFARVDNPRGLLPLGNKLFVLHTVFSDSSGLAEGMDLVVFEDADGDGVADGPSTPLIEHISNVNYIRQRGTDHATNGIRMGIDGWIYIAVGDFGFYKAIDRSGTELTMLGGGIVRVRPDGTGMEVYTHGLRNIYDVAIDPFMNIYTRGNTNDGGGWNIRFIHQIQSGEYGYPVLFKHFTEEILPALVDVGGGSGTGSLFFEDPTWPDRYNKVPMMTDWGRSMVYIHRVTPDGPSFTQQEEPFLSVPQVTDLDVDASGRMYLTAWDGAGFRGDSSKGFVLRAVPRAWSYTPFPDLDALTAEELAEYLRRGGGEGRLYAQQELITRPAAEASPALLALARDRQAPPEVRVAGLFGFAQIAGENRIPELVSLAGDDAMREFALRALADRKDALAGVPTEPFLRGLTDASDRVRVAAAVGLGRLGRPEAAEALLQVPMPPAFATPARGTEGPHATPNAATILPHVAVRSLVSLHAVDAAVNALGGDHADLALWSLRYMHDPKAVAGLIDAYESTENAALQRNIITTLARIYHQEAPYDGSWWWSTRPDTHGPYYKGIAWESTDTIREFLVRKWRAAGRDGRPFYADLNEKYQLDIPEFGGDEMATADEQAPAVNLTEIASKRGQVGRSSIEDVMLAIEEVTPDLQRGEELFTQQGCVVCHNLKRDEVMKGPFMGQIGSIMTRDQIAEAILTPNASISQGFATTLVVTREGVSYIGFVSEESADTIKLRNIAGQVFTLKTADIQSRKELENSMMPEGLTNALSFEEFASLVTFLSQQR